MLAHIVIFRYKKEDVADATLARSDYKQMKAQKISYMSKKFKDEMQEELQGVSWESDESSQIGYMSKKIVSRIS